MRTLYYFFYGIFRRYDSDPTFTSFLTVCITVCLYLIAGMNILVHFKVLSEYPRFSDIYLYNKLYWYIPILIIIGAVAIAFPSRKWREAIDYFDSYEDFYSFGRIMLMLSVIALPICIMIWL